MMKLFMWWEEDSELGGFSAMMTMFNAKWARKLSISHTHRGDVVAYQYE
jgi:hypothetical protein